MTAEDPVALTSSPIAARRGAAVVLYLAGIAVVAVVALIAWRIVRGKAAATSQEAAQRQQNVAAGPRVLVGKVRNLPPGRRLTLPGEVRPWRQATIFAKVSGYVKQMLVDKGDGVREGQLLATLESPETDQQVLSAKADLATKKIIAERYDKLAPQGVVSQQELDQASGNLQVGQAQLARASALEGYEAIRAPFAGVVTARYVDVGALLPAATGSTSGAQPLVEITDMNVVRIYVYPGQGDAQFVRDGMPVAIESDAHPGEKLDAKITRTAHALDTRTRTMLTEVDIDNKDRWVLPGVFVRVSMDLDTPATLVVPAEAVFLREGRPFVAVVQDGHAHFTPIEAGDDDGKLVRVVSGLTDGQTVALHVGDEISDGAAVQPVTPTPPAAPAR
jgi:membrane fusion protein, multidrug efflux system